MYEKNISLKDVQNSDIPFIYEWENDPQNWVVSERYKPYTLEEIIALIASSNDYLEFRQKRWMIWKNSSNQPIGTIDLFQGDLPATEAGIGILIATENNRRQGFAEEAIEAAVRFAAENLAIDTFQVTIHSTNIASVRLFEKCGFKSDNSIFDSVKPSLIKMSLCVKK